MERSRGMEGRVAAPELKLRREKGRMTDRSNDDIADALHGLASGEHAEGEQRSAGDTAHGTAHGAAPGGGPARPAAAPDADDPAPPAGGAAAGAEARPRTGPAADGAPGTTAYAVA